ncbi:MAG: TRAP transporter large permease [Thermodesulfobacteriota bacterium]
MEWYWILLLAGLALLFLMMLGVPIAFSLGFVALGMGLILVGPRILFLFGTLAYGKVNSFALVAVPLFIFMAEIIIVSGAAKDAFAMLNKWIGGLPAGLAIASQMGCTLFAAVCGASTATTAVVGGMCVPEMLRRGYDKKLATGSIAAGGALGVLIPPSILLIIYGIIAETSIGQLFIAGIIPGLLLVAWRVAYFLVLAVIKPSVAPRVRGFTWRERFTSLWMVLPLAGLALFMFGALYTGIATPSEVAGVGALAALVICLCYRKLTWQVLKEALQKTTRTTCFILWILVAASAFGYVFSYLQVPQNLVNWVTGLGFNRYVVIIGINLMLFVLGCVMDPAAIIMVTVPIFAPMVEALGFDLVWFGIMFVVNMELAEITPPLGLNLYVMKAVAPPEVSLNDIIKGSVPFMILDIVGLAMVIVWPGLVLWLPSLMM